MTRTCPIDRTHFESANPRKLYCSDACSMKAYRRRQAEQRHNDALARRKKDENQHRNEWCKVLVGLGLGRQRAEHVYDGLRSLGRLDGLPWDQPSMF